MHVCLVSPQVPVITSPAPVRVLFIGGDERQARCDERVRMLLCRWYPWVEVRFIHTGWSGNWGKQAVQIARLIPEYDAVVVMRFIRTKLGEYIRRAAGRSQKPWHACTGRGPEAIVNSIAAAWRLVN